MDRGVLAATIGASFKLFMLCGFVGWLLHSGRIPQESATVLSQVLPDDVLYSPHLLSATALSPSCSWSMYI